VSDLIAPVRMSRWDTGTLSWVVWDGSLTAGSLAIGSVVVTSISAGANTIGNVNQTTGQGKTLLFASIAQGGAGTTQLVAADATKKIKVVSYVFVMSLSGTVKFIDSAGDLTGAMPILTSGGVSAPGQTSSHWFESGVNKSLSIVTTTGAATGHIAYFLEA
jgi:hypothetical protein